MAEYISPDAANASPAWVRFCVALAPFSSIIMYLSPIPTIREVLRTGTVGDLPLLPYTAMVTSSFVWVLYGIIKGEPTLWGTNSVELTLSAYYFVEFTNYAPKQSPTFPGSVYHHIQLCVGTSAVTLFIALFFSSRVSTVGDITVLLTTLTFASPLAAVKAVIEHQSSEAIPWPFTLAALLNGFLWSVTGLFEMHDGYVATPALLGLMFALIQVALKLYFGDHHNTAYTQAPTAPVEMPYPILEKVRQVVLLGSHIGGNNSNPYHDRSMENHDLHLDMFSGGGNSDYVELGVPLTGGGGDELQQQQMQQPQFAATSQHQHDMFAGPPPAPPQQQPFGATSHLQYHNNNHKHSKSGEGLESVVFDDDDNNSTSVPPFPNPLTESFRSRSGSHTGASPGQHY